MPPFGEQTQIYERQKQKEISTFCTFHIRWEREIIGGLLLCLSLLGGVRQSVDLIKPY